MTTPYFGIPQTNLHAATNAIDAALAVIAGHHHTGGETAGGAAPAAPLTTAEDSGGQLAGGVTYYYAVTVIDGQGRESSLSPSADAVLPDPIEQPAPPALSTATTGGALRAGIYTYRIAAYVGDTYNETTPSYPQQAIVRGAGTAVVTLEFPTPPDGATGWNVYRLDPNGLSYGLLNTLDISEETWDDEGIVPNDCTRLPVTVNSTVQECQVTIEFDGTLAAGETWRIYRTVVDGEWGDSLIHHVVEETEEGSGEIALTYTDAGDGLIPQSPPLVDAPPIILPEPVDLPGETAGDLPLDRLDATAAAIGMIPVVGLDGKFAPMWPWATGLTARVLDLRIGGAIAAGATEGLFLWRVADTQLKLASITALFGWLDATSAQSVASQLTRFEIMHSTDAGTTWDSIGIAEIASGESTSDTEDLELIAAAGDLLRIDALDGAAIGADPTEDNDLLIQVTYWAYNDVTGAPAPDEFGL